MNSQDWTLALDHLPESPDSNCSYFSDRLSRVNYFLSDDNIPAELIEAAISKGFRRCGDTWYRPACSACNLCLSYRLILDEFSPSRNQRRLLKRSSDISYRFGVPQMSEEKEEIYLRYQYTQHFLRPPFIRPEESDKDFSPTESLDVMEYQMYTNPDSTREIEVRLGDQLVGFGIMDVALSTTSLVYFVFDPAFRDRSLGTLNILYSAEWSHEQGFPYLNLGYYIPGHMKMMYKARFGAAEILDYGTGKWTRDVPKLKSPDVGK